MAGQIHNIIKKIVDVRSKGEVVQVNLVHAKLLLKGIDPSKYRPFSADEPEVINKLTKIAEEMNIKI